MSLRDLHIDGSWALFLDRDGVINRRLPGDYVKTPNELDLLPGVAHAISKLGSIFGKIIVVSNQQGIGKSLMTDADLALVHKKMLHEITLAGGRIDAIFYSPHLENQGHIMRKPNVGMGLAARKKFPGIRFKQSIMVGDSQGDMLFGKRLGMKTVLVGENPVIARHLADMVDFYFTDLAAFADEIRAFV
ncbi:MAG: HAD-IIIA family hydrolase [Bacteroidales bacterium]|nr:HAD-IIIA family hydrolase [Bacteroidales bacterium]MDZ4205563.1 HAD-IIIA family hydrolase [Bacteroidales bacterium]